MTLEQVFTLHQGVYMVTNSRLLMRKSPTTVQAHVIYSNWNFWCLISPIQEDSKEQHIQNGQPVSAYRIERRIYVKTSGNAPI